jgi:hypothetical protein
MAQTESMRAGLLLSLERFLYADLIGTDSPKKRLGRCGPHAAHPRTGVGRSGSFFSFFFFYFCFFFFFIFFSLVYEFKNVQFQNARIRKNSDLKILKIKKGSIRK